MADRYVYSGGDGTNSSAGWTHAYTTLNAARAAAAAGDRFFIAHDHNEALTTSGTAVSWTFPGTAASPNVIVSINRAAGNFPPLAADYLAAINPVGCNANGSNLTISGLIYVRGLRIQAGAGTVTSGLNLGTSSYDVQHYRDCEFLVGAGMAKAGNNSTCSIEWDDCTLTIGASGGTLYIAGYLTWHNRVGGRAALAGVTPTNFLNNNTLGYGILRGLDLSAISTGKTLTLSGANPIVRFENCKIGTPTINAPLNAAGRYDFINCDTGATNYNNISSQYQGKLTTETTVVRTGGASDGTTPFSWKMVANANNEFIDQLETFEGRIWNDAVGSAKTLTVHILTDNVTLKDNEAWIEVEYLDSTGEPLTGSMSDGVDSVLSTGTNQASDSGAAWTTTGLTTPVKQKLEVTFTPQMKGVVRWKVKIAKVSTTVYVCPAAELT